jgi:hypothetical protein
MPTETPAPRARPQPIKLLHMVSLQMPVVVCRTIGLNNDAELHATADELDATAAVFVAAVENSDDIDANIDGLVR